MLAVPVFLIPGGIACKIQVISILSSKLLDGYRNKTFCNAQEPSAQFSSQYVPLCFIIMSNANGILNTLGSHSLGECLGVQC